MNPVPLPEGIHAWYLVSPAASVKRGGILGVELCGESIVVFRTESGRVHALAAHCAHMGTHLQHGCVVGERIQCPLHNRMYHGDGRMGTSSQSMPCQRSYPVAERYEGIFVFMGDEPFAPPTFDNLPEDQLLFRSGTPVRLRCSWHAPAANGFDLHHYESVHRRGLHEPPRLTRHAPHRLEFSYRSHVTDSSLSDRIMKWISRDSIEVAITSWAGPVVTVQSRTARSRSILILGFLPRGDEVDVIPIFGIPKSRIPLWGGVKLVLSGYLFDAFLRKDVAILEDMRFKPQAEGDEILQAYFDFLREQPNDGASFNDAGTLPRA